MVKEKQSLIKNFLKETVGKCANLSYFTLVDVKNTDDEIPVRCLKLLLLPVMSFCLRRSLKLQEIIEVCKSSLVHAAERELEAIGERITVNRVSVMTGIHRADIQRLARDDKGDVVRAPVNIINRLISRWQVGDRFVTTNGKPRVLTFDGKDGEFAELLRSVSADPNPYTVLLELDRIGAVEITPRGVRLLTKEYIINADVDQSFQHLSEDGDDLINAVEQNVFSKQTEQNLHLRTEYDNISSKALSGIRRWLLKEGSLFHHKVREYLSGFDRDINNNLRDNSSAVRVSVGSYSRTEPSASKSRAPKKTLSRTTKGI